MARPRGTLDLAGEALVLSSDEGLLHVVVHPRCRFGQRDGMAIHVERDRAGDSMTLGTVVCATDEP